MQVRGALRRNAGRPPEVAALEVQRTLEAGYLQAALATRRVAGARARTELAAAYGIRVPPPLVSPWFRDIEAAGATATSQAGAFAARVRRVLEEGGSKRQATEAGARLITPRIRAAATSEVAAAWSTERGAVAESAQEAAGVLMAKRWDATLDKRTCPVCWGADGETVLVGQPFSLGEPGQVHRQCRCDQTLAPASELLSREERNRVTQRRRDMTRERTRQLERDREIRERKAAIKRREREAKADEKRQAKREREWARERERIRRLREREAKARAADIARRNAKQSSARARDTRLRYQPAKKPIGEMSPAELQAFEAKYARDAARDMRTAAKAQKARRADLAKNPSAIDHTTAPIGKVVDDLGGIFNAGEYMRDEKSLKGFAGTASAFAGTTKKEATAIATGRRDVQASRWGSDKRLPAIQVRVERDGRGVALSVEDGRHRMIAAMRAGATHIRAKIFDHRAPGAEWAPKAYTRILRLVEPGRGRKP